MDFLKIDDISPAQLREILALSAQLKSEQQRGQFRDLLSHRTLLMLFEKNSTRTRISFETAMTQLGGHAIFLDHSRSQVSRGETMRDTGAAAGSMVDFIMARLNSHTDLRQLADGSPVPVINALTDLEHPCQALADLLTLQEKGKLFPERKICYVGDCDNNVAHSLLLAAAMMKLDVALVGPKKFAPSPDYVKKAKAFGVNVLVTTDPKAGLAGADAVYTDTWISMGMEKEKAARLKLFAPYQVNSKLMAYAKPDAVFMHCLPAHRGEEVSADVLDGPASVVFAQAQNRLHAQKGLLVWLSRQSK